MNKFGVPISKRLLANELTDSSVPRAGPGGKCPKGDFLIAAIAHEKVIRPDWGPIERCLLQVARHESVQLIFDTIKYQSHGQVVQSMCGVRRPV